MMCFLVEFWDVARRPMPPIKPMSEPYIDFEWPLAGWCIHLPQVPPAHAPVSRQHASAEILSLCGGTGMTQQPAA